MPCECWKTSWWMSVFLFGQPNLTLIPSCKSQMPKIFWPISLEDVRWCEVVIYVVDLKKEGIHQSNALNTSMSSPHILCVTIDCKPTSLTNTSFEELGFLLYNLCLGADGIHSGKSMQIAMYFRRTQMLRFFLQNFQNSILREEGTSWCYFRQMALMALLGIFEWKEFVFATQDMIKHYVACSRESFHRGSAIQGTRKRHVA